MRSKVNKVKQRKDSYRLYTLGHNSRRAGPGTINSGTYGKGPQNDSTLSYQPPQLPSRQRALRSTSSAPTSSRRARTRGTVFRAPASLALRLIER